MYKGNGFGLWHFSILSLSNAGFPNFLSASGLLSFGIVPPKISASCPRPNVCHEAATVVSILR